MPSEEEIERNCVYEVEASSMISEIGYFKNNEDTSNVIEPEDAYVRGDKGSVMVRFKDGGALWLYVGISFSTFKDMLLADSVGKFFNAHIKPVAKRHFIWDTDKASWVLRLDRTGKAVKVKKAKN